MRDRTSEFTSVIDAILSRQQGTASIMPSSTQSQRLIVPTNKTEFAKAASQISQELNVTTLKLQRLANLAKNKSLFDDQPLEINELVFVIKQDIAKINRQISTLADYLNKGKPSGNNKQIEEHSKNVISNLQFTLANTSKQFQSVLQVRTQNMKDQKTRRDEYSFAPQLSAIKSSPNDSSLYNPLQSSSTSHHQANDQVINHQLNNKNSTSFNFPSPSNQMNNPNVSNQPSNRSQSPQSVRQRNLNTTGQPDNQDTIIDFGSDTDFGFGNAEQNMSLMQNSVNMEIVESRASAIDSIESTIAELGQIYQHFAQILGQQRESIQRIDENVMDTEVNVMGAHSELLRYYQGISGNRWLMIKAFSAIIFFFLIYTVFLS